ncbi:TPA: hypothetical protein QDE31_36995 [Burkholderia cenocepacia]|nr:hypothetical protein [Burkholderia cenocepacia]HDR9875306.1 hypothetical protein [Burkholderia cenocepacia]
MSVTPHLIFISSEITKMTAVTYIDPMLSRMRRTDEEKRMAEAAATARLLASMAEDEAKESAVVETGTTDEALRAEYEASADSDLRLSMILANQLSGQFLYEHGGIGWRRYESGSWAACEKREQFEFAKAMGPHILKEVAVKAATDTDGAKRLMGLARRAMSATGIKAAIDLATSDDRLAVTQNQFDTHADLLNVANGVIHIPTGELRPHDRALKLVKQSPIAYDPDAQCPEWLKFMAEISKPGKSAEADDDWIDYMHRVLGYTLSGNIDHEKMFFMLGGGSNGKSVLANVMMHIMGPFATVLPTGVLMSVKNRGKDEATPSKARLVGTRLAFANEVEEGSKFDDSAVKELASKDAMSVRLLHQNGLTFNPSHKLWLRGNRKPIITATDNGIWRRIDLIPFDRQFDDHEKDIGLEARLKAESAGILAWLVRGYAEYQKRGLTPCKRIVDASKAYRSESDLLAHWIDDSAETGPMETSIDTIAFASYVQWCKESQIKPWSKTSFTRELAQRGIHLKKNGGKDGNGKRCSIYEGLRIVVPPQPLGLL